jgi:hypothetical protein
MEWRWPIIEVFPHRPIPPSRGSVLVADELLVELL